MLGLIVKHLGRTYKIGSLREQVSVIALINMHYFCIEGGCSDPFICSFQKLREGLEFEVEVAEFDDPSDPISEKNQIIEIDPEYRQMASDPDFGLDYKLEMFRRLESILKKDH